VQHRIDEAVGVRAWWARTTAWLWALESGCAAAAAAAAASAPSWPSIAALAASRPSSALSQPARTSSAFS